jgi:putative hemolysin
MLDEPRRLIVSLLCGNELVNIAAAANMTVILVHMFGEADAGWINIVVMVPLLLLFGEVTPKTIAVNAPVKFASQAVSAFSAQVDLHCHPLA